MTIYNVAIIGTGMIFKSHIRAIGTLENVKCVAVCDINETKAHAAGQLIGCPSFTDAQKMFDSVSDIHFCILCLPTFVHADYVELCAKNNKAVLCEKPMEMNREGALRVKKAVEASNIIYMTAQVVRFWAGYTEIKRMLDSGEIGNIYMTYLSRCSQRQAWDNFWLFDPKIGGGAMHDMLVHDVDFLNHLFGDATRVYSHAVRDDTGCFNNLFASIDYQSGAKAIAESSFNMQDGYPFTMLAKIMGDKATIEFTYRAGFDINQRDEAFCELKIYQKGSEPKILNPLQYDAYAKQLTYFIDCLENNKKPEVITVDQSVNVIKTIDAIERSSLTGQIADVI